MHKFSPALVFVSILSVAWSVDSIILVAQLGWTSPVFYNAGEAGFLFPVLVLFFPRVACWVGITVVVFELLISALLFVGIFISWADPRGVNVRVFGVVLVFLQ